METKKTRRANYKLALVSLLPVAFPNDFPILPKSDTGLDATITHLLVHLGGCTPSVVQQMMQDPTVQHLWKQALSHWSVGLDPPQNFNLLKNIGHTLLKSIFVNYIISFKGASLLTGKGQAYLTKLSMYALSNDLFESATDYFGLTPYIRYRALQYSIKDVTYTISVGIDVKNDVFEAILAAIVLSIDGCIEQGLGEAVATNICFAFFDTIKQSFPTEMEDMEEPDNALMLLFKHQFKMDIFLQPYFQLKEIDNLFRGTLKVDFRRDLNIVDASLPNGCCTFVSKPYENKIDVKKELGRTILGSLKKYNIKLSYKDKPPYKPYVDPSHQVSSFGFKSVDVFLSFIETLLVQRGGWNESAEVRKTIMSKTANIWKAAFTHKSFDPEQNYEYYEKVGDVRVECCIFLYVYRRFPHLKLDHLGTGKFTECVQHIKEKKNFSKLATKLGFVPQIRYKNSLDMTIENKVQLVLATDCDDGMKEDVFESFCGAVGSALDPYYTNGFGQGLLYNIMSSILDEEPLTVDINVNQNKVAMLKEGFSDLFLNSGDPAFECNVVYTENTKPGEKFMKGTIQVWCTIRIGWFLLENLKGGNFNIYVNKAYSNRKSDGELKTMAKDTLRKRGYAEPFNFAIKSDFVGTLSKAGGSFTREGIFEISFRSGWYTNDEIGKMDAKFEVADKALAFVAKAGFVWRQKPNFYIHPTSSISI